MALVIEYYSGEEKVRAVRAPSASIAQAVDVAREGLLQHGVRYARIIDIDRARKVVGMVHRDVLP